MSGAGKTREKREVVFSVLELLRFLSMYEALDDHGSSRLNFFRLYGGALMVSSIIYWWRYFGNRSEASHWQNFIEADHHALFRAELDDALRRSSLGTLEELWREIEIVRNRGFAHHDFDESRRAERYPLLSPLRVTSEVLYRRLFRDLDQTGSADGFPRPEHIMGERQVEIVEHWRRIANAARSATEGFLDSPWDYRYDGVPMSEIIERIEAAQED